MERKNIYIVILTITTIIAACLAVYFAVNPIVNENEEINNNDNVVLDEIKEEVDTSTDKVEEEEPVDIDNSTTVEPVVTEKIVYQYKRPTIDTTKCINPREGAKYSMYRAYSTDFCEVSTTEKNEVSFNINWYNVEKQFNITKPSTVNDMITTETKIISNFNTKVIDVCIANMGQGVDPVLFCLMEDGTVEYMDIVKALTNKEYKSYGKVTGVENVVEVMPASTIGGGTSVGLKQDGSFYDLGKIINEM